MGVDLELDKRANDLLKGSFDWVEHFSSEYVMPEHLLLALTDQTEFKTVVGRKVDLKALRNQLSNYLQDMQDSGLFSSEEDEIIASSQTEDLLNLANQQRSFADAPQITVPHIIVAMLQLTDSVAAACLSFLEKDSNLFAELVMAYGNAEGISSYDGEDGFSNDMFADDPDKAPMDWKSLVTLIEGVTEEVNPLIGRERELDRTIQVLCRKDKNNVLHVGEPGVGKTALIYGLAERLKQGEVPERLKDYKIYQVDFNRLIAGTSFRGAFEKKVITVLDGIAQEGKSIVYIDEMQNALNAGSNTTDSSSVLSLLMPYLLNGNIRFIGTTTYDGLNRVLTTNSALSRRFQQIDILEPSIDEAIHILEQLKHRYESFHSVVYDEGCIEYAVRSSARYISNRCLPDKAIDLIDEAGAYRETHPTQSGEQRVDEQLIAEVLQKVCKIESSALKEADNHSLETLEERIKSKIYGQDDAVKQVVEAVQLSKAGLAEDDKPMASLLFVGPTGVGKTELCKVLAEELGIGLVRFDMSEYSEKHSVAKLIGSPAGYVGYEEGGQLTDAIRNTPNCVLLLDEIEKAHDDIYNILLQVMDYARLTDNKGKKADFRHVILVLTSNVGAQYAHRSSMGFGSTTTSGSFMLSQVKKTFKPEFVNRLTGTVVFNDMDRTMANLVLGKRLSLLNAKLDARNVQIELTDEARNYLLDKGYSKEYGAREMDRVLRSSLNTLLMKEMLFGRLTQGGKALVELEVDHLKILIK